jgi:hypothetical protein
MTPQDIAMLFEKASTVADLQGVVTAELFATWVSKRIEILSQDDIALLVHVGGALARWEREDDWAAGRPHRMP